MMAVWEENDGMMLVLAVAVADSTARVGEMLRRSIEDFYMLVMPSYSLDAFRSHFQMTRSTFEVSRHFMLEVPFRQAIFQVYY